MLVEVVFRHRFVGRQHEGFNHPFRQSPVTELDVNRVPLVINDDLRFRSFKVNCSPPLPALEQDLVKFAHRLKHRHEVLILVDRLLVMGFQDPVDRLVGHPGVGLHHTWENPVLNDPALLIDFHLTAHRQPLFTRVQRTNPVRQPFRQHWNHPVGQVNGSPPLEGFLVQRRPRLDVVADVGNVDP